MAVMLPYYEYFSHIKYSDNPLRDCPTAINQTAAEFWLKSNQPFASTTKPL
jgi:hypothetical protein